MINNQAFIRRVVASISVPTALVAAALGSAAPASAAAPTDTGGHIVQRPADAANLWTVPVGTNSIHLHIVGASGADGGSGAGSPGGQGGQGGVVDETLAVKPGQKIQLKPGSQATPGGAQTWYGDASGGRGGEGDSNGDGGRGGAASWVTVDGQIVGIAGGGGGGGGGGAIFTYGGGNGGNARFAGADGSGPAAGSGGAGNISASSDIFHGEASSGAPLGSFAGGGGGGGAGWNGGNLGGGHAATSGSYGGGGGGGGAGGLSWGMDKSTTYNSSADRGDGQVVLDWTVDNGTASKLTAPDSAPQGRPVTLTDTVSANVSGGPAPTGEVTFEMIDINTYAKVTLGTAKLVDGVATLTTSSLPPGQYQGIHAIYAGDDNYQGSTSDFVYPKITAPIKTVSLSPSSLAFGKQPLKSVHTKDVQVTNTGSIDWSWNSASTDNADVNMPKTTCGTLKPGDSCTVTISYQPHRAGAITAHITFDTNFGSLVIPVTGTGVTPAPTVTKVSPNYGSHHGGTRVTITGTNFVHVSSITLGGKKLTSLSCSSSTSCRATTPAGSKGTHDIRVTTATGTSPTTSKDRFTYK